LPSHLNIGSYKTKTKALNISDNIILSIDNKSLSN